MRDHADAGGDSDETNGPTVAAAEEPRGRAAIVTSPKGLFHDWFLAPFQSRGVDIAYRVTTVALTVSACGVLIAAVVAGLG